MGHFNRCSTFHHLVQIFVIHFQKTSDYYEKMFFAILFLTLTVNIFNFTECHRHLVLVLVVGKCFHEALMRSPIYGFQK